MKLTEQQVRYVANLANLHLTDEEIGRMVHDLGGILDHMDELAKIDTEGVAPMSQVLYPEEETATLRADVVRECFSNEEALSNAPLSGNGYFKVPKVIER
jgi:aspartyl-tRNA(Asn)/glutamyl-tRNA(Gln) amidotransferase subunit C